jgi:hypothetical protein
MAAQKMEELYSIKLEISIFICREKKLEKIIKKAPF